MAGFSSRLQTGAVACYLWLSYNLYTIEHNLTLIPKSLINRLKNEDGFLGAYYEAYVAGLIIRSGMSIEFEDESDKKRSHCEFIAKHLESGKSYSVEAKIRNRKSDLAKNNVTDRYDLDRKVFSLITDALQKDSSYDRIIFIDINIPSNEAEKYIKDNQEHIARKIDRLERLNKNLPPAYIIITNYCYHYGLDSQSHKIFFMAIGFKINDFGKRKFMMLSDLINAKNKHASIDDLWKSISIHTEIPSVSFPIYYTLLN